MHLICTKHVEIGHHMYMVLILVLMLLITFVPNIAITVEGAVPE